MRLAVITLTEGSSDLATFQDKIITYNPKTGSLKKFAETGGESMERNLWRDPHFLIIKKKNKFIIFFYLHVYLVFMFTNEEEVIVYEKIIESSFDIDIKNVNLKGFKLGKNYDIKELPKAELVMSAIFNKKDLEIRKYLSQNDAIEFGEIYAQSVTGNDAVVSGDDVMEE